MRRPERTDKIQFLTPDEIVRLFSVIESKRDRAIFLIAYRHGLRASEVGHLRSSDLDLTRFRIRLYRLKGSHGGEHPLQPDEVKVIKAYLRSRSDNSLILFPSNRREPISRQMLDVLMKRYSEDAKIPKDKRHFLCSSTRLLHIFWMLARICVSCRTGWDTRVSTTQSSTPFSPQPHGRKKPGISFRSCRGSVENGDVRCRHLLPLLWVCTNLNQYLDFVVSGRVEDGRGC